MESKQVNSVARNSSNQTPVAAIISSLHQHYMAEQPAPDNVVVYKDSVRPIEDEEGFYQATVKITVDYVGVKHHKVNLKFKTGKSGRILPSTIGYLY